jgi:hypothetical protein
MNFYNSGYGYETSKEGYVISHGQKPSERTHKYVDVWSAYDALPPNGHRIKNGEDDYFYTRNEAVLACAEHARRVA